MQENNEIESETMSNFNEYRPMNIDKVSSKR